MKLTVLQLTQNILSDLDSDAVNSISDTTESLQVAYIIQQVYNNIVARDSLPEHSKLFQLTPSTDNTKPVLMYRPDNISKIEWMKYYDTDVDDDDDADATQHD